MIIKIRNIPFQYYNYAQWLLLGLYQVCDENEYSIHVPSCFNMYRAISNIKRKITGLDSRDYCLVFDVFNNGQRYNIVYDFSDTPFLFDEGRLANCDFYFKAQHPKNIASGFFSVQNEFEYKYPDFVMGNLGKIKPSLLGVRSLGRSIKYDDMLSFYQSLIPLNIELKKTKNIFCYFGTEEFPKSVQRHDFHDEAHFYNSILNKKSHPNQFRGVVAKHLVRDGNYVFLGGSIGKPIPFSKFHQTLSNFKYNVNVSGFRYSIPNRFMDSFLSGTNIITDNLFVNWYVDFSEFVHEFGHVGYAYIDDVCKDVMLNHINEIDISIENNRCITDFYNTYLSPISFAKYILGFCK